MITERDIFNFVFFNHMLDNDKIREIEENESYKYAVEFYNSVKKYMESEITSEQKKKIASKIPAYKLEETFVLYPVEDEEVKKKNIARFAAASGDEEGKPAKGVVAKTYLDKDKNYLIRFVKINSEATIHVFSVKNQAIKDFEITILPAKKIFQLEDNSEPIVFESNEIPESIEIRLR